MRAFRIVKEATCRFVDIDFEIVSFTSIFIQFDTKCTLLEDFYIWFFYKSLRLLIKLKNNREVWKLDDLEELIKKTPRAKKKTKIQSVSSHNIGQHYYYES